MRLCTFYGTLYHVRCRVAGNPLPRRIPLVFFRTAAGSEPVREWLRGLEEAERLAIGKDLLGRNGVGRFGMPLCRPAGTWPMGSPNGPAN